MCITNKSSIFVVQKRRWKVLVISGSPEYVKRVIKMLE
nr:MAG TPA: Bacterial type II/III secretion system short domain protein [Caudoviricetes sp.]